MNGLETLPQHGVNGMANHVVAAVNNVSNVRHHLSILLQTMSVSQPPHLDRN